MGKHSTSVRRDGSSQKSSQPHLRARFPSCACNPAGSPPADAQQPRARRHGELLKRRTCTDNSRGSGAERIDPRTCDRFAPPRRMPREIAQNVDDGTSRLLRRLERVCVVPVREHPAAPLHQAVQGASDTNGQTLNSAREPHGILGLDDQVKMVALHAEVNEPEPGTSLSVRESSRNRAEAALATQVPDVTPHAQRDVHRVVPRQRGTTFVGDACLGPRWLPSRTCALPSVRRESHLDLLRPPCHLESALFQKRGQCGIDQLTERSLRTPSA